MTKALKRQRSVLGSGLGLGSYLGLLALSVLLFVGWGGWMWQATASDSHVGRFAISYLSVVPLAALVLWLTGAFSLGRLATAVGTLWGIKLVITAPLYFVFGPRGGMFGMTSPSVRPTAVVSAGPLAASAAPSATSGDASRLDAASPSDGYEPAGGAFDKGDINGTVSLAGKPQPGALVYLVSPAPGRELDEERATAIVIDAKAFERPLYLGFSGVELRLTNGENTLRTLALRKPGGGKSERNIALPPRGKAALSLDKTGLFELACRARGGGESLTASLMMVDHPYAVLADERGAFSLKEVPAGAVRVAAMMPRGEAILRTDLRRKLPADGRIEVNLPLQP